jgi:hypothetical protein
LAEVSQWTGRGSLVSLVLDVTSAVEWPAAAAPVAGLDPLGPRPQILLTLLTYGYARGVFSSEAIMRTSMRDPVLGYLCAGATPTREQVRQFRRRHRPLIAQCLGKVLFSAWQFRLWLGLTQDAADELPAWLGPDTWSESQAAAFFAGTAERRVDHAVLLDSMALDG